MVSGHRTAVFGRSAGAYFGVWSMRVKMEPVQAQSHHRFLALNIGIPLGAALLPAPQKCCSFVKLARPS